MKLYQFPAPPRDWGIANQSPFCMKVETYLRMTGTKFESVEAPDPRKFPKGKLPVLEDEGKMVPDSGAIFAYLKATYGDLLDQHLSARDKAIGHMVRRTLEESFYWSLLYSRWIYDPGWQVVKPVVFGRLPAVARMVVPDLIRKKMREALHAHGAGRHSESEIFELGRADLAAVSEILGDKTYLFGDRPSSFDAIAYGFVAQVTLMPLDTPLKRGADALTNLVNYSKRMREQYFPA